ncbi:MAG: DUF2339 domain-containing protein [Akkermansiaceae bacterium]
MSQDLRAKLDRIIKYQAELKEEVLRLNNRYSQLNAELDELSQSHEIEEEVVKAQVLPPPIPDVFFTQDSLRTNDDEPALKKALDDVPETVEEELKLVPDVEDLSQSPEIVTELAAKEKSKSAKAGEWELNFGRVWLVRIGVLMLLTGLIFLSTYAYKNWLFHSGPVVKVGFFMTVSLALTAAGIGFEKWREKFKQYGRVLTAGGLAAGYYTIYAAHFVPSLKLIDSPIIAGLLLSVWAAIMVAYSVWKKSRLIAVMGLGMAFYGTVVNPSEGLSLFSSLLLSLAGIWLMLRYKWISVGLTTVVIAYVSHAFWLGGFYNGGRVDALEATHYTYIACYWLLFTVALALPQARSLAPNIQRMFCVINNSSAWFLSCFIIPECIPHKHIGWISIGIGSLWLLISLSAYVKKIWPAPLTVIYGYQGIFIVSLGILIEATGYSRFLIFAVEACVLIAGARHFGGKLARAFSLVAFACAFITALPWYSDLSTSGMAPWQGYAALTLVFAAYTALMRRDLDHDNSWGYIKKFIPLPLAVITWTIAILGIFNQWTIPIGNNGLWLLLTAVLVAYFLLKSPKWLLDMTAVSIVVVFYVAWQTLMEFGDMGLVQHLPCIIGASAYWYMCPQIFSLISKSFHHSNLDELFKTCAVLTEWLLSFLFWIVLTTLLNEHIIDDPSWLWMGGLLAMAGHAVSEYTKRRSIGVPALLGHVVAIGVLSTAGRHYPMLSWAPCILLLIHLALVDYRWKTLRQNVLFVIIPFLLVMAVSSQADHLFSNPDFLMTLLGVGLMIWAYMRKRVKIALAGSFLAMFFACAGVINKGDVQNWVSYIAIIATLSIHLVLWKKMRDQWRQTRVLFLVMGLMILLYKASMHVLSSFDGSGLSICWALIALVLFAVGLIMRCRPYRLIGFGVLVATVFHVVSIDVMKMETLGRILSFIVLGILLLVFGFLYNRFQDSIRKFL